MGAAADKQLVRDLITKSANDLPFFARTNLKILHKKAADDQQAKLAQLAVLKFNKAQLYLHEQCEAQLFEQNQVRIICLKGRQQGISTYVSARFFQKTIFSHGTRTFILTHLDDATRTLFGMVERYYEKMHPFMRPAVDTSNAKELWFSRLDSGYAVGTAGSKAVGRSLMNHRFHGSEVALWPNAEMHVGGVMETIPMGMGSEIILESTAMGVGNYFHKTWVNAEKGVNEYRPVFIPWYWDPDYRSEPPKGWIPSDMELHFMETYRLDKQQTYWFHEKNISKGGEAEADRPYWLFLQEYPFVAVDAFRNSGEDAICSAPAVESARVRDLVIPTELDGGVHLIGVDPARQGQDASALIHRRLHKAWGKKGWSKLRGPTLAAKIIQEIEYFRNTDNPVDAVLIDVTGIGASTVDAMHVAGYGNYVIPVDAGETARDDKRFQNVRAEMWSELGQWFLEEVDIPNDDKLHGDIMAQTGDYNLRQRFFAHKKADVKKKIGRSPDDGDALAITFAVPVQPKHSKRAGSMAAVNKAQASDWRLS